MNFVLRNAMLTIGVGLLAGAAAKAQTPRIAARPSVRVTESVDVAKVSALAGTHPLIVDRATVMERLASGVQLEHIHLLLKPSDEQVEALRTLLDEQQDRSSANYHKWMTPETFGQSFGAAPADIAQVTAWLQQQGFSVESVSKSNRVVSFSGTAGQVENAFHTRMNKVSVNGEVHIANTTDLSVPTALATVVRGVASLNDFFAKSNAVGARKVELATGSLVSSRSTLDAQPLYTTGGTHYVGPRDAATIYNSTPLTAAGIDGTGITLAVLGRSNITLSDVQAFRSIFGLKKNDPTITVIGNDPGQNVDDTEAYLDVEWAGGMAPGASVNFLVGGTTIVEDGIDLAGLYAVNNNIGDIITVSYGECETNTGAGETAFWNSLWEQAAAQGQTGFVSTGDSGATGCDADTAQFATHGYGVNALGSSAYNVAVGGTMFVDFGPSQYWTAASGAPYSTASSYIPEAVWNESSLTTTALNGASTAYTTYSGILGSGGGVSIFTARPSWQTGSGISAASDPSGIAAGSPISGLHRLVPDVAMMAAVNHDPAVYCGEGFCNLLANGSVGSVGTVGGTSVAAPVMASAQALIDQKNGGRQGNANYFYYKIADAQYQASTTACQAQLGTPGSSAVTLPAATCDMRDVVSGANNAPTSAVDTTGLGFAGGIGYDEATGLGSVNIANMASDWATVSFRATTTTFALSPASGVMHGTTQIVGITVSPASGTGTPTGDVSVIAENTASPEVFGFTLSGGVVNNSLQGLPAGSYKVHAHYAGDGVFGASDSASLPVTIAKEDSVVTPLTSHFISSAGSQGPTSTFTYGQLAIAGVAVKGLSASGTARGQVVFQILQGSTPLPSLTMQLDSNEQAFINAGASYTTFYIAANYPALTPASYTVTANYSGDNNFNANSAAIHFTVNKAAPVATLIAVTSNISSATPSATLNYSIAGFTTAKFISSAALATGTVTFTDTTTSTLLGSATLTNGAAVFTTSAITSLGAHNVSAAYSGDANYSSATKTTTVTVATQTATQTTLVDSTTTFVGTQSAMVATVSPVAVGTVYFYDGSVLIGSATSKATDGTATLGYGGFTAGTHTLTATFAGTSSFATSSGTTTLNVSQTPTSMKVSAPAASTYGQAVAMNGSISRNPGGATPIVGLTGSVTFYDGSTPMGTQSPLYEVTNGTYTANVIVSTLLPGSHSLKAVYSGDANYVGSASVVLTTTIAKLTPPLTLSSSATAYGQAATVPLTATLVLPGTLAVPVGNVNFYDRTTLLGSSAATYSSAAGGYVATYGASGLSSATHSFTAQFAGDTNYNAATSAVLTINVATNNLWVANSDGTVSGLRNDGSVMSAAQGVSGTGAAVAVDGLGNVWSLNTAASSVAEFTKAGVVVNSGYSTGGITAPTAMAFDGAGLLWIVNGNNSISVLDSNGAAVSTTGYKSVLSAPTSVSVDGSGNLWITNTGDGTAAGATVTEVIGVASPVITPLSSAVTANALGSKP